MRVDTGELQPVARRLVRELRAHRPELPALAEQRPLRSGAGGPAYGYYKRLGARMATAPAQGDRRLRRHRHEQLRACSRRSAAGARGRRRRCSPRSSARWTRRRRLHDGRSVGGGAGAGARRCSARATRSRKCAGDPDAVLILLRIRSASSQTRSTPRSGIDLTAVAQPAGVAEPTGPFAAFAPPPTMAAVVPGQTFDVGPRLTNRGRMAVGPGRDRARHR